MAWLKPINFPVLADDEVHVWEVVLDCPEEEILAFFALLSATEQGRAKRFHFIADYQRFTISHGILRTILAHYLNCHPQELQYTYSAHGKPELAGHPQLQFNLSHSQNRALIAVTWNTALGVDIESMVKPHDIDGIATRFFSTQESELLKKLTGQEKIQAFFNGWTRKEAFLKALGKGLSFSLKNVEVSMLPQEPAKFLAIHDDRLHLADWFLYDLSPIADFASALVVKGVFKKLKLWRWVSEANA